MCASFPPLTCKVFVRLASTFLLHNQQHRKREKAGSPLVSYFRNLLLQTRSVGLEIDRELN
jgi:hypothetical protein